MIHKAYTYGPGWTILEYNAELVAEWKRLGWLKVFREVAEAHVDEAVIKDAY